MEIIKDVGATQQVAALRVLFCPAGMQFINQESGLDDMPAPGLEDVRSRLRDVLEAVKVKQSQMA